MADPRPNLAWEDIEPERYEIFTGPAYDFDLSRRELWKVLGAGVLFVFTEPGPADAASGEALSTRLHVGENGAITLMTGKVEVGQGSRTELTQVVAEELGIDPGRVRLIMGDTKLVPDDGGTWGSLTTPQTVPVVRRAAAAARKLFPSLKPGEQLPGTVPSDVAATDPAEWKVCGTSLPPVKGEEIVTGRHRYSGDLKAPEMLYGKVVRPDGHHAELVSYDASDAEKMPGVRVVRDGNFLGVVAPDRQAGEAAAARVRAVWKTAPLVPAAELNEHFKHTAREPEGRPGSRYSSLIEEGAIEAGMKQADHRLEGSYSLRYIAHVPLEPRSALAEWHGDSLTVHSGTQVPFGVRRELAEAFHIPEGRVRVIVPDTGAGFGGKHRGECQLEAARLSRAAGRPVLLSWSREEEFTWSYARPAGLVEVRSGARKDGKVLAWEFHNYNSGAAGLPPPYDFANVYCGFHPADSPLRQGSYRSLAAVANTFARETHVEEIAEQLKIDPLDMRLRNLADSRLRTVAERAAERFGWGKQKGGNGRGFGLACNLEKGGYVALCVELESDGRSARLERMVVAMECGAIVNPDNLRNQITGAVIQGIGGALFEELRYDKKNVVNARLSAYRVPRFSDVPRIEVVLVDRRDLPSAGAGESPITVVAPAIGAALHQAIGRRFRSLPMLPA